MTKVLRMLYGIEVATEYFEKQLAEFGDLKKSDLYNYQSFDKVQTTREN